jgi:hypothetical protein
VISKYVAIIPPRLVGPRGQGQMSASGNPGPLQKYPSELLVWQMSRSKSKANEEPHIAQLMTAYLEYSLHLSKLCPRMFACKHLDHQATNTPDIRLSGMRGLFDNLWGHPEYGALKRWSMRAVATSHEICDEVSS